MKTPREILLARSRDAEPKLDAIRNDVVAKCVAAHAVGESDERQPALKLSLVVMKIWQELIWPCRRIWLGMAAAWVVILTLNIASGEATPMATNLASRPTPEVLALLQEQRRMMVQLLEPLPSMEASRPKVPGPRSEQRETVAIG
jgi:hypothetical protein